MRPDTFEMMETSMDTSAVLRLLPPALGTTAGVLPLLITQSPVRYPDRIRGYVAAAMVVGVCTGYVASTELAKMLLFSQFLTVVLMLVALFFLVLTLVRATQSSDS